MIINIIWFMYYWGKLRFLLCVDIVLVMEKMQKTEERISKGDEEVERETSEFYNWDTYWDKTKVRKPITNVKGWQS